MKLLILALCLYSATAFPNCKEDNWDAYKVGKAVSQGLSKETLLMHLGPGTDMAPERLAKIKGWIEEAYQLGPEKMENWWKQHHRECAEEKET